MAKQNVAPAELVLEEKYGVYESWTSPMYAEVRGLNGKVVKRFKGESAWSNANRYASDLGAKIHL
jgi:hypothetical protein